MLTQFVSVGECRVEGSVCVLEGGWYINHSVHDVSRLDVEDLADADVKGLISSLENGLLSKDR